MVKVIESFNSSLQTVDFNCATFFIDEEEEDAEDGDEDGEGNYCIAT